MMEIKQSTPNGIELKDLKEEPINGLKSHIGGELEPTDILQLSDSENEDEDIAKNGAGKNESPSSSVTDANAMEAAKVQSDVELSDDTKVEKEPPVVTAVDAMDTTEDKSSVEFSDSTNVDEEPKEVDADSILEQETENKEDAASDCPITESSSSDKDLKEEEEQVSNGNQEKHDADSQDTPIADKIETSTEKDAVDAKSDESVKEQSDASEKELKATDTQPEPQIVPDSEAKDDLELLPTQEDETFEISSEAESLINGSKTDVGNTIELDDTDDEADDGEPAACMAEAIIGPAAETEKSTELDVQKNDIPKTSADISDNNTTEDKDIDPLLSKIDEVLGNDPIEHSKTADKDSISMECGLDDNNEPELPNTKSNGKEEATEDRKILNADTAKESTEIKSGEGDREEDDDDDDVVLLEDDCENDKESPNEIKEDGESIPKEEESSSKTVDVKDKAGDIDDDVVLLDCDEKSAQGEPSESKEESESIPKEEESSSKTADAKDNAVDNEDEVVLLDCDEKSAQGEPNENKEESESIPKEEESSSKTAVVKDKATDNDDDVVLLDCDEKSAQGEPTENTTENENQASNLLEEIPKPTSDAKNKNLDKQGTNEDADDVVLVLDEDMDDSETNKCPPSDNSKLKEEIDSSTKESKSSPTDEKNQSDEKKTSQVMDPDNSDNAQDKFPEDQEKANAEAETASPDNDNLLEQVPSPQNTNSNDRFFEEEREEMKQSDTESSEISQDISKKLTIEYDEQSKDLTIDLDDENNANIEPVKSEIASTSDNKSFKRSLSPDATLLEAKKIKIAEESSGKEDDKKDIKLEDIKPKTEVIKKPKEDLNLDFLKRFKKPLSKMSKSDLEELVLQKIVEAVIHRSELSDMREVIDKQEKLIATHRTKIAEITKQFRDLEMVHNRVTKDLEQKNQQFIMPVKITRAVGLQVLIPKRSEHAATTSVKSITNTSMNSTPPTPKVGGLTVTPVTTLNDSSKRTRPNEVTPIEPAKRIRCNQKVTPLRPDTPKRNATGPLNNSTKTLSATPSIATQTQQNTSTPNSSKQPMAFKTVMRNIVPSQQTQQQASPLSGALQSASQIHVVPASPMSNNSQLIGNTAVRKSTTPKAVPPNAGQKTPITSFQSSPERRVPPVILKKANNGRNMTIANPPPTAAQNASKSVIDLTDEDEKPAGGNANLPALVALPQTAKSAAAPQAQSRVTTYVISKPNAPQRPAPIGQNGNATAPGRNRFVPIAPKPAQAAQSALASGMRAQQSNIAAVTTLSAKRISAPAPLPKPPHVPSHPSWKASPPRPTIRINNIESGIVISWTMDDSNDGHAEVTNYQIYAYQETSAPPQSEAWRHVGDVKAMLLPMAVTLTQFQEGQRYFFAVRAIDTHGRYGPFSIPKTWS